MKHVGKRTDPEDIASQEQLGGGGAAPVAIDGGAASAVYGGSTSIDGGTA